MIRSPVGIELFAGCGGMSTGFLDAGFHIAAGFEIESRAVDVYDYNHAYRGSRGFCTDLSTATGKSLLERAGVPKVDIVIGGPPCQPFSIVGKRLGVADKRSDLMGHFARIVEELKPKAFLLENVPNLAVIDGGKLLNGVIKRLEKSGYAVSFGVVSAADFGVAQMRRRLIVLGVLGRRSGLSFPEATHGVDSLRTVQEVLDDLPDAGEFGQCGVYNHEPTMHSEAMRARLKRLKPGERERGSFHDRLHPDRLSYTIRAGSGNFSPLRPIHYLYDRVITVRESARIQGFSDDFVWPDRIPRLQQYRQVGNAVPPPLAAAFATAVAKQLRWKLDPSKTRGNPAGRPPAMTLTDDQRIAHRRTLIRGASLGRD